MSFADIPMIIVVLATGYLLTVYLLLTLVQRNASPHLDERLSLEKIPLVKQPVATSPEADSSATSPTMVSSLAQVPPEVP